MRAARSAAVEPRREHEDPREATITGLNEPRDFTKLTAEQIERTFRTNIFATMWMSQAALEQLEEGAVIINTGSVTAMEGNEGLIDYSATKGAIHTFTKSLARAVGRPAGGNCAHRSCFWLLRTRGIRRERSYRRLRVYRVGTLRKIAYGSAQNHWGSRVGLRVGSRNGLVAVAEPEAVPGSALADD
jgi:NAD(P)-dependent dehydrogenase (short-subunit alcohol dehydrogenase family)